MSGGGYDYLYQRVEDMAYMLARDPQMGRRAFAEHLKLVAKAMHDIEWVDSGDYSEGDEMPAIAACISDYDYLKSAIHELKMLQKGLNEFIEQVSHEE
jgi:hypothetical protein